MYSACIFTHQRLLLMPLAWLAAMGFDLVILFVTISGLWFMVPGGRSALWTMLFADGSCTLHSSHLPIRFPRYVLSACPLSSLSAFF